MSSTDPSPGELVHEAKEMDEQAARLAGSSDPAAADAKDAADAEWKAADALTSKVEGFTPGDTGE